MENNSLVFTGFLGLEKSLKRIRFKAYMQASLNDKAPLYWRSELNSRSLRKNPLAGVKGESRKRTMRCSFCAGKCGGCRKTEQVNPCPLRPQGHTEIRKELSGPRIEAGFHAGPSSAPVEILLL